VAVAVIAAAAPPDEALLAAAPLFSRHSRLLGYTTINRSLDLLDGAGRPSWLRTLRRTLGRQAETYAATLPGPQDRPDPEVRPNRR
jgi:hypothetical protein